MINAVGRDIPEELLADGKEVYQGKNHFDGTYVQKAAPKTRRCETPQDSKLCATIREACERCGAHDGMTVSFHHHFRNGDKTAAAVMKVLVEDMGLKDITIAATSLGDAHNNVADYIEQGKVIGIQSSGVRGRMATVCEKVVTVTTPGDCVDVVVTDYGIAVNPLRPDLIECLDNAGIPHVTIEELKDKAYQLVGEPDPLQWDDQVVAVVEARDGSILDVIRKIKPYTFE